MKFDFFKKLKNNNEKEEKSIKNRQNKQTNNVTNNQLTRKIYIETLFCIIFRINDQRDRDYELIKRIHTNKNQIHAFSLWTLVS